MQDNDNWENIDLLSKKEGAIGGVNPDKQGVASNFPSLDEAHVRIDSGLLTSLGIYDNVQDNEEASLPLTENTRAYIDSEENAVYLRNIKENVNTKIGNLAKYKNKYLFSEPLSDVSTSFISSSGHLCSVQLFNSVSDSGDPTQNIVLIMKDVNTEEVNSYTFLQGNPIALIPSSGYTQNNISNLTLNGLCNIV